MVTLRFRITTKGVVSVDEFTHEKSVGKNIIAGDEKNMYTDVPKPKNGKLRPCTPLNNDRSKKRRRALNPTTAEKQKENSSKDIKVATPTTMEGRKALDIEMSPGKAFHDALLKRRFANIIFKATHQTDQGKKDFATMRREGERLRREKAEAYAKIEAEVEVTSAAVRKIRIQREREAARMKLEKMQKTIDIYGDLEITKEFEKMIGCGYQPSEILDIEEGEIVSPKNVLDRLGLYRIDHCSSEA